MKKLLFSLLLILLPCFAFADTWGHGAALGQDSLSATVIRVDTIYSYSGDTLIFGSISKFIQDVVINSQVFETLTITGTDDPQFKIIHTAGADSANFYVDGDGDLTVTPSGGDFIVSGNSEATTYGSDASVSDAELLYINSLSSNAQDQIDDKVNIADSTGTSEGSYRSGKAIEDTSDAHMALFINKEGTVDFEADQSFGSNYALDLQNLSDRGGSGASYRFDDIDNYITVSDAVNIQDIANAKITISFFIYPLSAGSEAYSCIVSKLTGADGWLVRLQDQSGDYCHLEFYNNFDILRGEWQTTSRIIEINKWSHIIIAYDGSSTANDPILYLNGKLQSLTENVIPNGDVVSDAGADLIIGNVAAQNRCFDGQISEVRLYNYALTTAEVEALYSCTETEYKYKGASQTELTSGTLTIGKAYRINDWITDDDFTNVGGTNVDGSEFVATGTTPTTWTNSSTVVPIGEVAAYRPQDATPSVWYDASGNGNDGTVSGATLVNPCHTGYFSNGIQLGTSAGGANTANIVNDGVTTYRASVSLADAAELTMPTGVSGWGEVMAGDNQEWAHFRYTAAGVVTLIANSANVTTTNDTDANMNIYDGGSGIIIENQLGGTLNFGVVIHYYTP